MKAIEPTYVGSFITRWERDSEPKINRNRELTRVDVTVDELIARKDIESDETFIGTKVIAVNINRELPRIFSFLTESSRFLLFRGVPNIEAKAFELWFAREARTGLWTFPHLQCYYAAAIHGIAFVEILCDLTSTLGTKVEYVEPSELIYAHGIRDIQTAGLIARKFTMPVSYVRTFGEELQFIDTEVKKLEDAIADDLGDATCSIYKLYYRDSKKHVMCRWFSKTTNGFLSPEVLHCSGAFTAEKKTLPTAVYPFVPLRYSVSADVAFSMLQGRAILDEPLQEAIQGLTSAYVNGSMRASGFYPYVDDSSTDSGNTINQMKGSTLQHNRIANRRLAVFQPAYPDPALLNAVQLLKTTASNDAGQTDFATVTKRMTNTTATEIAASSEQAKLMSSIGVSMMSMHMYSVESYRFEIFRNNAGSIKKMPPEFLAMLALLVPVSVIDEAFRSRDEKVALAKQWLELLKGTPAFVPLMLEILREDLPNYYELIKRNMPDTKPIAQAMLAMLANVAQHFPEIAQDPNYVKVLQAGNAAFGAAGGAGPEGAAAQPEEGMAPQPTDAGVAQGAA